MLLTQLGTISEVVNLVVNSFNSPFLEILLLFICEGLLKNTGIGIYIKVNIFPLFFRLSLYCSSILKIYRINSIYNLP